MLPADPADRDAAHGPSSIIGVSTRGLARLEPLAEGADHACRGIAGPDIAYFSTPVATTPCM